MNANTKNNKAKHGPTVIKGLNTNINPYGINGTKNVVTIIIVKKNMHKLACIFHLSYKSQRKKSLRFFSTLSISIHQIKKTCLLLKQLWASLIQNVFLSRGIFDTSTRMPTQYLHLFNGEKGNGGEEKSQ